MVAKLVLRGIIAGIIAGLLAFGYGKFVAEPTIQSAIDLEGVAAAAEAQQMIARGETPPVEEPDPFSRDIQSGVGLMTGTVGVGAGLGAILAIIFAFANGRISGVGPKGTALTVAALGLITFYLVPALKYPANPPASSIDTTIGMRTGYYFMMMGLSVAATVGALYLRKALTGAMGLWNASIASTLGYIAVLAVVFAALPVVNETPDDFPAVLMYNFRVASLGTQAILWLGAGLVLGYLINSKKSA